MSFSKHYFMFQFKLKTLAFDVMAPMTVQGATLNKNSRADPWTIVH